MSTTTKTNNTTNYLVGFGILGMILLPMIFDGKNPPAVKVQGEVNTSAATETKEDLEKEQKKLELKKQILEAQEKLKSIESNQSSSEEKKVTAGK